MSAWAVIGTAVAGAIVLLCVIVWLLTLGHAIPAGRSARFARLSRMAAGFSASWLGAKLRRLFASKHRRERIDASETCSNRSWRADWREVRDFEGREVFLTPTGIKATEPGDFPLSLSA